MIVKLDEIVKETTEVYSGEKCHTIFVIKEWLASLL